MSKELQMSKRNKEEERRKYRRKHGIPQDWPRGAHFRGRLTDEERQRKSEANRVRARERYRRQKGTVDLTNKELIDGRIRYTKEERRRRRNKITYAKFRRQARQRGLSVGLTCEEFTLLREKLCYYCSKTLPPSGSGLDRIDNAKGYEKNNVLPCCALCNMTRTNKLTVEELQLVIEHRKKKT